MVTECDTLLNNNHNRNRDNHNNLNRNNHNRNNRNSDNRNHNDDNRNGGDNDNDEGIRDDGRGFRAQTTRLASFGPVFVVPAQPVTYFVIGTYTYNK